MIEFYSTSHAHNADCKVLHMLQAYYTVFAAEVADQ